MDRARDANALRFAQWNERGWLPGVAGTRGVLIRQSLLALLTAAVTVGCGPLGTDLDTVIALEIQLPDSLIVGGTLVPQARALNGRGDAVAAEIIWSSLDTAIVVVLDSANGETYGKAEGIGRLQARTGALRSNPQSIVVWSGP